MLSLISKSRIWTCLLLCGASLITCQPKQPSSEFTGNKATYNLPSRSSYQTSGVVTFEEKKTGEILVTIVLKGAGLVSSDLKFPCHIHYGDIEKADTEMAVMLNPVDGKTGKGITLISKLTDGTEITYSKLLSLDISAKVHLGASGSDAKVVLAGGNVGNWSKK